MSPSSKNNEEENADALVEQLAPRFEELNSRLAEIARILADEKKDNDQDQSKEEEQPFAELDTCDEESSHLVEELRSKLEVSERVRSEIEDDYNGLKKQSEDSEELIKSMQEKLQNQMDENQSLKVAQLEESRVVEELTNKVSVLSSQNLTIERASAESEAKLKQQLELYDFQLQECESLRNQIGLMNDQVAFAQRIESLIWPEFLEKPEMKEWKDRLVDSLNRSDGGGSIAVLISNLFSFNSFIGLGGEWSKRLYDVLQDFSRGLFAWCDSSGLDPDQAVHEAKKWAQEFSAQGEGIFSIEVPEPDEPFNQRMMVSYETGNASGSMDVKAVKTWCIRDEAGRLIKQAEVITS